MKGYRCDNCRDFAEEEETGETTHRMFGPSKRMPDGWISLRQQGDEDKANHFCSHACVIAYSERRTEAATTPTEDT